MNAKIEPPIKRIHLRSVGCILELDSGITRPVGSDGIVEMDDCCAFPLSECVTDWWDDMSPEDFGVLQQHLGASRIDELAMNAPWR